MGIYVGPRLTAMEVRALEWRLKNNLRQFEGQELTEETKHKINQVIEETKATFVLETYQGRMQ